MKTFSRCALAVLLASVASSGALAGNNSGGTAHLSWDRSREVSKLATLGSLPFPLFLQLQYVSDVRELAVHLEWMPYDSLSCSYHILPAPVVPDASVGWAVRSPTTRSFEGDSSYNWQIVFPAAGRNRVVYWFTTAGCDTAPRGRFFLTDVRTRDSAGRVDRLRIIGQAVVHGGPLPVNILQPQSVPASQPPLAASALVVSPNPTSTIVLIRYALPKLTSGSIDVYDVTGRLARSFDIRAQDGSAQWRLDDASGSPVRGGLYFARLTTPIGSHTVRFVVLR